MKLLIANWKMNPGTLDEARHLAEAIDKPDVIICAPYPFLAEVRASIQNAGYGAQDMFSEEKGAYTGAVSPTQLFSMGVGYVVLGHSERRAYFGETDEAVAKKVAAALLHDISPILCIGETLAERSAEKMQEVLKAQLTAALGSAPESSQKIFVAYEPVWAISTNKMADSPEITLDDITEAITYMREVVEEVAPGLADQVVYLYGGSINARNISEIFSLSVVEGGLVGGASLKPEEFNKMLELREGLET